MHHWTYYQKVMRSTSGQVVIGWLFFGLLTVCELTDQFL